MINPIFEKLAKVVVNYSIEVKRGQRIAIIGPVLAKELYQALYAEIIKNGGYPLAFPQIEGLSEIFYKLASEEQLIYVDDVFKYMLTNFDGYIQIFGDYNTQKLTAIDPQRIAKFQGSPKNKELMKIMMERSANEEMKWVIIPFPCQAYAQEANMDLFSYREFVYKALLLDKENPLEEWKEIQRKQENIVNTLNKVENIRVIGEGTDLSLSVKGRLWKNCCGKNNLPDGEVYTGPVEDSVNGTIQFTFPGIYQGRKVENIQLEFKDGKVIKATAEKGQELLNEILKIENADRIGEFAIGTNYGITQFTKNMLFDEKMGGTLHCALGLGMAETGSKNMSAIHWDILKDMKGPDSKIFADEKLIYDEGKWKF
ncbi:MAG: aminopeptidase [Candidatus Hodarchaeota archaeon]